MEQSPIPDPHNVFEFMTRENTIGLGMLLSSITFSLVSELKIKLFDPLFEEVFPFSDFVLSIDIGKHVIDLGGAFYEVFRWINYSTILFLIVSAIGKHVPTFFTFMWMFLPFVILMLLKRIFVHPAVDSSEMLKAEVKAGVKDTPTHVTDVTDVTDTLAPSSEKKGSSSEVFSTQEIVVSPEGGSVFIS
tara:strand:- start:374 stop:940 length:567 start_codon:yes stop_codon:yes gene_type:complete